jgi:hypothetical protein
MNCAGLHDPSSPSRESRFGQQSDAQNFMAYKDAAHTDNVNGAYNPSDAPYRKGPIVMVIVIGTLVAWCLGTAGKIAPKRIQRR